MAAATDSVANIPARSRDNAVVRLKRGSDFASAGRDDGDRLSFAAMFLLVIAVLLGGGHIEGPIRNGLVEAIGGGVLLSLAWRQWRFTVLPSSARAPLIMWIAVLALFLLYLVPLPAALRPGGRDMTEAVLRLGEVPVRWRPLSLDPAATIRMAASLLVPIAMTFATLSAGPNGRILLIRTLLILVAASAALGMVQLALGYPTWTTPFGKSDPGVADGLFVNRNHQSMFMLIGLIATGLLIRLEARSRSALRIAVGSRRLHLAWFIMPMLTLMTVASASRAGIALLVVVLPGSIMLGVGRGRGHQGTQFPRAIVTLIVGLLVGALAFAMLPAESIATLRARMVFSGGARMDLLPDVMTVVGQYWPWGSGPGTFVPVFKGIEDLDKLGPNYLNHAHNEYLEWATETGLLGSLLLVVAGVLLGRLWIVLGSARSDNRKALALGGAGMLLLLAAHSAIDYPLRTDAHAALFGLALGLLFTPAIDAPATRSLSATPARGRLAVAGLIILGVGFTARILQLRLAELAAGEADGALAVAIHSRDGFANGYAAEALLEKGDLPGAKRLALAAIDQTPLSIVAIRTLALAEARLGNAPAARNAWRAAAGLGWRDIPTQYWAMRQALADGENTIAGMRADALLRMSQGVGPFADLSRAALTDAAFRHALVERMAMKPQWRQSFFFPGKPVPDAVLPGLLATLRELQRTPAPPTRVEARDAILALIIRGRVDEAVALDRPFASLRHLDRNSLLDDGDFQRSLADYQGASTPFDWTLGVVSRNSASLDESQPRSMVVATEGSDGLSSLRRWIALSPGRYRLDYRMRGEAEAPSAIGVWVSCGTSAKPLARSGGEALASDSFESRSLSFDVTLSCPIVNISLGGIGQTEAEASFTGFRLTRI